MSSCADQPDNRNMPYRTPISSFKTTTLYTFLFRVYISLVVSKSFKLDSPRVRRASHIKNFASEISFLALHLGSDQIADYKMLYKQPLKPTVFFCPVLFYSSIILTHWYLNLPLAVE